MHVVGEVEPRPVLLGRLGQDLVVDVGDVADERDVVPLVRQPPAQHVEVHRGPDVADVGLGLHGQAADVDARLPLLEGDEVTNLAGRGVVEPECHRPKSMVDGCPGPFSDSLPRASWRIALLAPLEYPRARGHRVRPRDPGHHVHPLRGCRDGRGQEPRHRRRRLRRGLRHADRQARVRRPQLRAGPLDRALAGVVVPVHRADRLVAGDHARRQLDRGRGARPQQQGRHGELGRARPLDRGRQVREAHQRLTAARRPRLGRGRHLAHRQRRTGVLAAAALALPQGRHRRADRGVAGRDGQPAADAATRWRCPSPARASASRSTCRRTPRWRTPATTRSGAAAARRGARRPRPRWCSAWYDALPPRSAYRFVPAGHTAPLGRLRGPAHLRRAVRRHRQLAVQHGVRRPARRRRLRHPAAVAARGRGLHRRRHPARRLDLVGTGRADRRARLRRATVTWW